MAYTLSNLKSIRKAKKRVGRGNASGSGNYSSRGMKGQRSRSGGKGGLKLKGFKQNLLNIPKMKGNKSIRPNNQVVNLSTLEKQYKDGETVNPATLSEKGIISRINNPVKILLTNKDDKFTKKIEIFGCSVSQAAKVVLEKAGCKILNDEETTTDEKTTATKEKDSKDKKQTK
jgi:large subunit ribosomal protein L15